MRWEDQTRFQFKFKRVIAVLGVVAQADGLTPPEVRDRLESRDQDYCLRTVERDLKVLIELGFVEEVGQDPDPNRQRGRFRRYAWTGKKLI